jgi:hypothetical protein
MSKRKAEEPKDEPMVDKSDDSQDEEEVSTKLNQNLPKLQSSSH